MGSENGGIGVCCLKGALLLAILLNHIIGSFCLAFWRFEGVWQGWVVKVYALAVQGVWVEEGWWFDRLDGWAVLVLYFPLLLLLFYGWFVVFILLTLVTFTLVMLVLSNSKAFS